MKLKDQIKINPYRVDKKIHSEDQVLTWNIAAKKSAVLIHDLQEFFLKGYPESVRCQLLSANSMIISWARNNNIPVIFSGQKGSMRLSERGLLYDFWGAGMSCAKSNTALLKGLDVQESDLFIAKSRYSAFFNTNLLQTLKNYNRDSLIITGVYASIGIYMTACDAFSHDIKPFIPYDAVLDFSYDSHKRALKSISSMCAKITSVNQVVSS